jgi:hypothetical protein
VCRFANGLKALGYKKGERAIIYMPMSVEGGRRDAGVRATRASSTRSCSAASPPRALQERIQDAGATLVIAADEQVRGGKMMPLKPAVDEAFALGGCESVRQGGRVSAHRRQGRHDRRPGRDLEHEVVAGQGDTCEPEWVGAEHPLFILYTSGSTGKPKGVQHSSGGYLLHAMLTMKWTFDIKPSDVFWCTADIGWVTGHTYVDLRPAGRRRDRGGLRRRTHLSERGPLLADDPEAQGQHLLHRAHRDPLADQGLRHGSRDTSGQALRPVQPAAARFGRRTDQSRSLDVVLQPTSAAAAARSSTPSGRPRPAAT